MMNGLTTWWSNHRPTKRRLVQLYSALLYNANLKGFVSGQIYTGKTKALCVPGFNCYSCPGATGACPLGSLQASLAASDKQIGFYVLGILLDTRHIITTFSKPDFISIFFEMCTVIVISTDMVNFLFEKFKFFFFGMIVSVFYDILDYFYLRTIRFHFMESVESWVRFFGFFGFIGKCLVLFCLFVINVKNKKNPSVIS